MRFPGDSGRWYVCEPSPVRGGQAEVYRASSDDDRCWAVKIAGPGGDDGWLHREAEHLEALLGRWPDLEEHLVPVVDQGVYEDRPFLVMPWRAHRLDAWVQRGALAQRLAAAEALALSVSRLQHGREGRRGLVVHRDIKPSNAFVLPQPDGSVRVQLSDFGTAGLRRREATTALTRCHTEGFAPIDQFLPRRLAELDGSWDVYALAATIYVVLTGERLHGVQRSYAQLTLAGRALWDDARAYEQCPSAGAWERIVDRSRLPLSALIEIDAIEPVSDTDRAFLEQKLTQYLQEQLEPRPLGQLVGQLADELCGELALALDPDPARRAPDARGLHAALVRIRATVQRVEAGQWRAPEPRALRWQWLPLLAGVAPLAALAASVAGLAPLPRQRDVQLRLEGVPDGIAITAQLVGSERSWSVEGGRTLPALPVGSHTLLLQGSLSGRCRWSHPVALELSPGVGPVALSVAPRIGPCPTADHGYTTQVIPPGTTWLGAPDDEWYREPDEVWREVTLSRGLLLGQTEVSQAMWTSVMGSNPVATRRVSGPWGRSCADYRGVPLVGADHPVVCVTWCEAVRFANAVSEAEGLQPAYEGVQGCEQGGAVRWLRHADGWRLPTEAEWEHAARAGGQHRYVAGSLQPRGDRACAEITRYGNVADRAFAEVFPEQTGGGSVQTFYSEACRGPALQHDGVVGLAPVGSFAPNAWGLSDMTGNAREWVFDLYGASPAAGIDVAGPTAGSERTFRGSAFDDDAINLRLANRGHAAADHRLKYVGLRLARNADATLEAEMITTAALWIPPAVAGGCEAFAPLVPDGISCRAVAPAPPGAFEASRADDAPLAVQIQMEINRAGQGFRPVPLSTPVCNGDYVAFTFTPSADGYIHVLSRGTSGSWNLLHPETGPPAPFAPGDPARLPRSGSEGYPISGPAGTEHVMFFVSPGPFPAHLQRQLDEVGLRHHTDPPVAEVGQGTRAVLLQGSASTEAVVVGHEIVAFPIEHRAQCGPLPR